MNREAKDDDKPHKDDDSMAVHRGGAQAYKRREVRCDAHNWVDFNRDSVQRVGPYIARRARGWEGERIGIRCRADAAITRGTPGNLLACPN